MRSPDQRLIGIDALKGIACVLIVWHHLAFYGPMSDVIYPHAPGLTDWLYDYGRMAVQVFLVVSGFLAASSLAPGGVASFGQPARLVFRRYLRLVRPFLVALAVALVVAFGLVGLQLRAVPRRWLQSRWLTQLGQMSYSVFLIHFSVCLLVNAVVSRFWPAQMMANALGLLAAFLLSLLAGAALYRAVESRTASPRRLPEAGAVIY